ncbi:MAG TPA: hypothetical protein VLK27_02285 [Chthoniobacterales bacterium]|nr:hypothetical protein [Chthoniobacterales bacterium]
MMKPNWTLARSGCSVWRMWKTLVALVICATPALAQEQFTAYDALRVVGVHINREAVNHVVSVTGTHGSPQPKVWRILIADRGSVREVQVRNGQVVSDRPSSVVGSAEGSTINTARLNLDSSGAFQVASHIADKSGTRFDSASYTLRTDQHGDPVWIITLHEVNGQPVGTVHIGANRGTVTRTEGMFAGATMQDVATEQHVYREERHHDENREEVSDEEHRGNGEDDEHGPLYGVRQRMRGYFQRAQEQANDTFQRVRQSFDDSVNR